MDADDSLPSAVQSSWHDFLDSVLSLRPDLYRYCRQLSASPWDAEDLVQDALARAFVTLGQLGQRPPNPRAWLFRVASNLWIDQLRRRRRELLSAAPQQELSTGAADPRPAREAAGTLLGQLSPQERAAVVLKDVFDCSLEEVAETLETTVGAVKAALHRARGRLVEPAPHERPAPTPAVLDAFCEAFNAGDLERVTALLLDAARVEVVGATVQYGREAARQKILRGMLFGVERMVRATPDEFGGHFTGVLPTPPRVVAYLHRGAWVLLHFYAHHDGDAVRAITRLQTEGDRIACVENYFYNPDLLAEVCAELGLTWRVNGYRWWARSR